MPAARPIAERWWGKVEPEPTSGCFIWVGMRDVCGYGTIGRERPRRQMLRAHRLSWEMHKGPIPHGLNVLHRCDNPWCVSPAHLFLGTQKDNARDAADKKRMNGQRRTRCPRGHPLDSVRLRDNGRLARYCKACHNEAWRRWYRSESGQRYYRGEK